MAADYHFTTRQNTYLQLLQDPQYEELWAELLGGFAQGGGEVMSPYSTRTPTGTLQCPLPVAGTITSQFGHRVDPITARSVPTPAPTLPVPRAPSLPLQTASSPLPMVLTAGAAATDLRHHRPAGAGRAGHWLCWSHRAGDRQPSASGSKNRGQPCGCNTLHYKV